MTLLIVAAVEFEAKPLLEGLRSKQFPFEFFPVGIDPLNAARSSKELSKKCEGREVLYLGSCGSFAPFKKPYLIQVCRSYWMPAGIRAGLSDIEEGWYPPFDFPKGELTKNLPAGVVLTSPEISLNKTIKRKSLELEKVDTLYENMELYPISQSLLKAKSLHTVLGVTNEICADSRKQWKENFKGVSLLTRNYILEKLFHSSEKKAV